MGDSHRYVIFDFDNTRIGHTVQYRQCLNHEPHIYAFSLLVSLHFSIGRAIYILQQTLPDFFSTGLVSSLDATWNIKNHEKDKAMAGSSGSETESIYSSNIRLTYTPRVPLPTPFPRTIAAEGKFRHFGHYMRKAF